ncbi:glycosyltransferase family 1 protein [Roseobacter fucihabitans]|nr:glycosyltransferase family 1 protein [Roseobacter litoralis]
MNITAGRHVLSRGTCRPARAFLARRFSRSHTRRVLVYYNVSRISWSQIFPFVFYGAELAREYDAEFRFVPVDALLEGREVQERETDIILIQPWFTTPENVLDTALDRLATAHPKAEISFLDSYAHNDLRLARTVDPYITHYLKKSLFKDKKLYFKRFRGDTNLLDYYGKLYGLEYEPVDWAVPYTILPKLRLSPNFLTSPHFIAGLSRQEQPARGSRNLDVSVRLGGQDSYGAYAAMRCDADTLMTQIKGITRSPSNIVPFKAYMNEMRASRLCFSPFGFGELCWRDIEAMISGTVMIKPDMSHLETLPNLYEPGVTYLPMRWDFGDREEVIQGALADEGRCTVIAKNAYDRMASYIREARFVTDMGFLFS